MTISFFLWSFILTAAFYASINKTEPKTKTTTCGPFSRPTRVPLASGRNQLRHIK
jgi:hypothetical protein